MRFRTTLAALALLGIAAPAAAQQGSIRAGMSPDEVRAAFGAPARTRDEGDWSYWFYNNGCPVRCGSDDVVFLQNGKVVAAVLRTGVRNFEGPAASSAIASIEGLPPTETGLVRMRPARAAHRRPAARRTPRAAASTASRPAPSNTRGANGSTRMRVIRTGPVAGAASAAEGDAPAASNGRTAITGAPTTIVGTGGAGATVGGVTVRRGSRAAGDSSGLVVRTNSDSSVDQERLDREKRITPRVMPTPAPGIRP
ncbi:MAG TPA: hypothetical protein VFH27_15010 [Longimicrobiaceae bacterium]|nr:hypothetical protein [Longimicrobiaceae bacterium]